MITIAVGDGKFIRERFSTPQQNDCCFCFDIVESIIPSREVEVDHSILFLTDSNPFSFGAIFWVCYDNLSHISFCFFLPNFVIEFYYAYITIKY